MTGIDCGSDTLTVAGHLRPSLTGCVIEKIPIKNRGKGRALLTAGLRTSGCAGKRLKAETVRKFMQQNTDEIDASAAVIVIKTIIPVQRFQTTGRAQTYVKGRI